MTEGSIMRLAIRLACATWLLIVLTLTWIAAYTDDGRSADAASAVAAGSPLQAHVPTAPANVDAVSGPPDAARGGNI